ncbi:PD-(D/E)XK nuclease-like domain-containing protein [Klebsiella aerogenes]|nr:PD-(D/E)XK nuclease-like domain-containing protein [Klebsiella aerogenes]
MEYFYLIKATQKSGKADAVIWRSAKTESRALLQLDVDLEDAEIETGRGKDYQKPIRTDFPVFNDLPAEGVLDYSWCERYQLADDGRTWALKPGQEPADVHHTDDAEVSSEPVTGELVDDNSADDAGDVDTVESFGNAEYENDKNALFNIAEQPFRIKLLAQYMANDNHVYQISIPHRKELAVLEMDTDNSAVQDLILAAENVQGLKDADMPTLWKFTSANKAVFPEGKRHELGKRIQFAKLWFETPHIDRGILVREWSAGNYISAVQKTDTGTNAGGSNKTDRNPDYTHTLDTLDVEIALATMPMDFDIYNFPASIHRRAKEIVQKKESPFKEWSAALRKTAGILDYSRAAIFALIRGATSDIHHFPVSLQTYINANMTEHKHDAPSAETLEKAGHVSSASVVLNAVNQAKNGDENKPELENLETAYQVVGSQLVEEAQKERSAVDKILAAERGEYIEGVSDPDAPNWVTEDLTKPKQPEVSNMGNGVFSIDGLVDSQPAPALSIVDQVRQRAAEEKLHPANSGETTSDVQMETAQPVEDENDNAVSASEGTDATAPQADAVNMRDILAERCPDLTAAVLKDQQSATAEEEHSPEPTETKWPEFFEPGRYEGVPNDVYHAANGISSTMVKDARISLMYFHARHIDKTISRDSTDALTFGSLVHSLVLEPEKFEDEFAVFPGIPADAFTNTDTLKAFIREYNADKPKTEQLKLTGKKEELQESIRAVKPDAIFADEYEQQWRESVSGKTILTSEQLTLAKNIQQAIFSNSDASDLLNNPGRQSEVSYFGIDEETGLNIRVRPDIELRTASENTCADLKTISIGNVRQDRIKERLHREIIDRDYHLSAAMYCDVAGLDSFSWIFVNKEPGYHWVAVVEASESLLELGRKEYRRVLRQIYDAMENDIWPAPITETYTDELNDYDTRRLEALDAE